MVAGRSREEHHRECVCGGFKDARADGVGPASSSASHGAREAETGSHTRSAPPHPGSATAPQVGSPRCPSPLPSCTDTLVPLSPAGAPLPTVGQPGAACERLGSPGDGAGPVCDFRHVHGLVLMCSARMLISVQLSSHPRAWSPWSWWAGQEPRATCRALAGSSVCHLHSASRLSHVASGWTWRTSPLLQPQSRAGPPRSQ